MPEDALTHAGPVAACGRPAWTRSVPADEQSPQPPDARARPRALRPPSVGAEVHDGGHRSRAGEERPAPPLEEQPDATSSRTASSSSEIALQLPGPSQPRSAVRPQRLRRRQLRGLRRHELGGLQPAEEGRASKDREGILMAAPSGSAARRRLRGVPEGQPRPRPGRPRNFGVINADGGIVEVHDRCSASYDAAAPEDYLRGAELVPDPQEAEEYDVRSDRATELLKAAPRPMLGSRRPASPGARHRQHAQSATCPRRLRRAPGRPGPVVFTPDSIDSTYTARRDRRRPTTWPRYRPRCGSTSEPIAAVALPLWSRREGPAPSAKATKPPLSVTLRMREDDAYPCRRATARST